MRRDVVEILLSENGGQGFVLALPDLQREQSARFEMRRRR